MNFKYFPQTEEDIRQMLDAIGVKHLENLFDDVPQSVRIKNNYDIPSEMSEIEIRKFFKDLGDKNKQLVCFAGGGVYDHYTPSIINYITQRSEFLTSYTPYQAEVSQGTLQYIFEYQTMMADLTGMEISNASMYDGTTATAESMMMAIGASKNRNRILVSATLHPQTIKVLLTYSKFHNIELVMIPEINGQTNQRKLAIELSKDDVAGVIVGQPNYYGIIEDWTGVAEMCHSHNALFIMNCPASPLATIKTPGEWGADIAVGDAQTLGLPMNFGGPFIGYLCTREALIRKMPGRIVGATQDIKGNRTFVLTFQAREQHIRRQKATSNICTSQGLMTLFVGVYLALMGPSGMKEANTLSYGGAHYLHDELIKTGLFKEKFNAPFYNEFCVTTHLNINNLQDRLAEQGFLCGIQPQKDNMHNCLMFAVTEKRSKDEIDHFVRLITQEG